MQEQLPPWFAADQVFDAEDGWYVGVTNGFRIGPFAKQRQAQQHSRDLTARLRRCRDTTEMVRVVRQFVLDQTAAHGRQIRPHLPSPADPGPAATVSSAPAAAADKLDDGPAVRSGEAPRVWFRTNRVYAVGGVWYFSTREGIDIGPYPSRRLAEHDLTCLVDILSGTTARTGTLPQSAASRQA